jgi:hypothetical protein
VWPLGPSRTDLVIWGGALAAGAVGTLIAWAAGARLGSALTLGVGLLMVGVIGGLLWQERDRRFPGAAGTGEPEGGRPRPRPVTRGRR